MVKNRIKFLDGIRFLLALWVVLGHFYTIVGGIKFHKFNRIIEIFLTSPILAVYGFIIITGFLMMHNYFIREKKELPDKIDTFLKFWTRRFFRLYPLYILVVISAFFLYTRISLLAERDLIFFTGSNISNWGIPRSLAQPSLMDLVSHIFLFHGLVPKFEDSILGVTWSLSLEMQFYFLFPFIFLYFFRNTEVQKKWLFLFILLCSAISAILPKVLSSFFSHRHLQDYHEPSILFYIFPFFLLGMLAAGVKVKKMNSSFFLMALFFVSIFQFPIVDFLIGLLLVFVFLENLEVILPRFIFKIFSFFNELLSNKVAEFGADISYSLYLIHTLVIPVVLHFVIINSSFLKFSKNGIAIISLILTLIVCFCICYLLYRFIEKPFILLGKKLIQRMSTSKSAENYHPVAST